MLAKKEIAVTLEKFESIKGTEGIIYELIDGAVMMTPRPNLKHQEILVEISGELRNFFKNKRCKPVIEAEIELADNILVPDIFIYCDPSKITKQRYIGAPTIVIEILSSSTAFRDLNVKYKLYEKHGVVEYWIVNLNTKSITIHHFVNKTVKEYLREDILKSDIFEDMSINLKNIFE